jgi:uncharacterized protein (TIGR03083 family)
MADSPWPAIHAERQALADDLSTLTDQQWQMPSMCSGWTVHEVLGHILATVKITPPKFIGHFAGAGFNFDKMTAKDAAAETRNGPAATLADFRANQGRTNSPPGPTEAMLGEAIIHAEDIRRPLGITRDYPAEPVTRVLDFYKKSNLIVGAKKRIDGLTLRASDTGWTHGSGPEVTGPAVSLLLAMTGRREALADLHGDGVDALRSRG